jgi:hypothetical protein
VGRGEGVIGAAAPLRPVQLHTNQETPTTHEDTPKTPPTKTTPSKTNKTHPLPATVARDVLPKGRPVYRLLLTYKFTATEGGKFTPRVPLLNECVSGGDGG